MLELRSSDIKRLVAGKLTSAAITADGDVLTWGCGKAGKLGHGSGVTVPHPSLVHALWGRASIASVAMGEHHMLLLDGASGQLWACGENKEGQVRGQAQRSVRGAPVGTTRLCVLTVAFTRAFLLSSSFTCSVALERRLRSSRRSTVRRTTRRRSRAAAGERRPAARAALALEAVTAVAAAASAST